MRENKKVTYTEQFCPGLLYNLEHFKNYFKIIYHHPSHAGSVPQQAYPATVKPGFLLLPESPAITEEVKDFLFKYIYYNGDSALVDAAFQRKLDTERS